MLEAVQLQGLCLQFASKELQGNPKVQGGRGLAADGERSR